MDRRPDLSLVASTTKTAAPGAQVLSLQVAGDVDYAAVRLALEPAVETLVRLKIVIDERWLLPITVPPALPPPKPKPDDAHTAKVGHRKITRDKKAKRDRFADIRLDGDRVELFVENERPGGDALTLSSLKETLRSVKPPVSVAALTASPSTKWQQVEQAIIAAACFDRKPGDEPHEIILD